MSKSSAAVLLFALFALAQSRDPREVLRHSLLHDLSPSKMRESRQTDYGACDIPAYPAECTQALSDLTTTLTSDPDFQNIDLDAVNSYAQSFCEQDCITPVVEYYRCIGQTDIADFYNEFYCGEYNGKNCITLYFDNVEPIASSLICTSSSSTCQADSECANELQGLVTNMGCCAASAFGNPQSPFSVLVDSKDFENCQVTLGDPCAGAVDSSGVNRVALGLLTVFVAVAAFINTSLF